MRPFVYCNPGYQHNWLRFLIASLLQCLALSATAQDPDSPQIPAAEPTFAIAPLPVDPAIRMGRLENKLTYYIRRNTIPAQRAVLWLVVNTGSVLEEDAQQGLAHFVEHMAFNGTRRFHKNTLIDFAERAGIDFGADLNAYTTYDETVYMLTVPTDNHDSLLMGMNILEDWATGLTFDPEEVAKERGVVIEEWRRGRGARQRIDDEQRKILLAGSRYANRDTIGEKAILERAPASQLQEFYRDWYRPELTAVVIVGDIDPDFIETQIRRRFNQWHKPVTVRPRLAMPIPFRDATRVSVLSDAEASRARLSLSIKGPRTLVRSENEYRQALLESLFSLMLNARLGELRNRPETPYLFAYNSISEFGRTVGVFQLTAMPKPGRFEQSLASLLTELERVRQHGFLASEFERQKAALQRFYEQAHAERDKTDSQVFAREIVDHFLKQEAMPGIGRELQLVNGLLPGIDITEVNNLAQIWSSRRDRVILASGPAREVMPAQDQLLSVAGRTARQSVGPYRETVPETELITELPVAGSIVAEQTYPEIGVTLWTLSNGARVVAKPTDFKNDEVLIHAVSPGGLSLAPDDQYHSAAAATGIIYQAGLGPYDATQLGKLLADKAVWVRSFVNELEEGITGNAAPADLEILLQMAYLSFTAPRLDADAFAIWKERTAAFVKNRDVNPQTVFNQEFRAFSDNYHPRSLPMTMANLDSVDPQTAYSFVQDRYGDAGDFTFVFVGNVDLERLRQLSEIYLASLPTHGRKESWRDVGVQQPQGTVNLTIEKGKDPKSMVRMTWHGDAAWSVTAESNLELLNEVIDIRLREVLREKLGGVYGATSYAGFYRWPRERYSYTIGFDCAPQNVAGLRQAVFNIIETLKISGADAEIIAKVQELRRRQLEINLKQNRYWLNQLVRHFRYGTDPRLIEAQEHAAIDRITSDNVRNAARLFLGDNRIDGLLMPEPGQTQ